jgi:predicted nucleic acid-binding protein
MIVLDTNVLSELMKPEPEARVVAWVAAQDAENLFTTSISQAEILHGVGLLPSGRRRRGFEAAAEAMFREDFRDRVLAFDSEAARPYAEIAVERRRVGRPISHFDAQIAAIAVRSGAMIATRNVTDFEACGVRIIDPWNAG